MDSTKVTCAFLHAERPIAIIKFKLFKTRKTTISPTLPDKGFKGTVRNRALTSLHGGSLEITLTFPLMSLFCLVIYPGV